MPRAAVLGSPITHSLSPVLHTAGYDALGLSDWSYERIELTADRMAEFLAGPARDYAGFSVTMPNKFAALELATEATERARVIGSANTLVPVAGGWRADNTDCEGVAGALRELLGDDAIPARAVVIGAGGTSRPALWALADLGVREVTVVNRSDRREQMQGLADARGLDLSFVPFDVDVAQLSHDADVIVSTVPSAALAGMEADLGHTAVLDVIYDPWPTPLTVRAAANGHSVVGGHVMLAHQSYSQFEQFTGRQAPREEMRRALESTLQ